MLEKLELLIEALREELKHYGEMLALLDQQQEVVVAHRTQEILQSVADIQRQGSLIQQLRKQREFSQRQLAQMLELPRDASLSQLLAGTPVNYRPLVGALVEENNKLLFRVQQRARQNHLLLSRSLELCQKLIMTLFPSGGTPAYNQQGHSFTPVLPQRSLYEAVG